MRTIAIIGHPLAAPENILAFEPLQGFSLHLIAPRNWHARTLGHRFHNKPSPLKTHPSLSLSFLSVLFSGYNSLFVWIGLKQKLKQIKPDLIYCWEEPWCLSTWQIRRMACAMDIPWVFYSAENRPKKLPWFFNRLRTRALQTSIGCIAPTEAVTYQLRNLGYTHPVGIVPLWIASASHPLQENPSKRIAYIGRIISLKRVDWLIEALAWLPDFELKIIGDGPQRALLQSNVAKGSYAHRIAFAGHCPNSEIPSALSDCGLVVIPTDENPSQAEQFGKAALEGVAYGLPVLTSRSGHYPELAKQIPTLIAEDFHSPQDLADKIRNIFSHYPSLEERSKAKERVQQLYGPQAAAAALHTFFITVLNQYHKAK